MRRRALVEWLESKGEPLSYCQPLVRCRGRRGVFNVRRAAAGVHDRLDFALFVGRAVDRGTIQCWQTATGILYGSFACEYHSPRTRTVAGSAVLADLLVGSVTQRACVTHETVNFSTAGTNSVSLEPEMACAEDAKEPISQTQDSFRSVWAELERTKDLRGERNVRISRPQAGFGSVLDDDPFAPTPSAPPFPPSSPPQERKESKERIPPPIIPPNPPTNPTPEIDFGLKNEYTRTGVCESPPQSPTLGTISLEEFAHWWNTKICAEYPETYATVRKMNKPRQDAWKSTMAEFGDITLAELTEIILDSPYTRGRPFPGSKLKWIMDFDFVLGVPLRRGGAWRERNMLRIIERKYTERVNDEDILEWTKDEDGVYHFVNKS